MLGSAHPLTPPNKPHNSLYLIGSDGRVIDRYDKRFATEVDLGNFLPGNRFVNFTVNGGVTVIFTGEPRGSDREYQSTLAFGVRI